MRVPYLFVFSYSWRCYTKHYFEEGSRICSSIGGGGFKEKYPIEEFYEGETPNGNNGLSLSQIQENLPHSVISAYLKMFQAKPYINRVGDLYNVVRHYETNNGAPEPVFYYHSDQYPMTIGETKTFTIPQCVGIEMVYYNVELYPNPANDMVTITTEGVSAQAQITIVDMAGKIVGRYNMAQGVNSINVDVSAFAEGSYLVRIVSDSNVRTERLIIKE